MGLMTAEESMDPDETVKWEDCGADWATPGGPGVPGVLGIPGGKGKDGETGRVEDAVIVKLEETWTGTGAYGDVEGAGETRPASSTAAVEILCN